jgi:hypothetical protein
VRSRSQLQRQSFFLGLEKAAADFAVERASVPCYHAFVVFIPSVLRSSLSAPLGFGTPAMANKSLNQTNKLRFFLKIVPFRAVKLDERKIKGEKNAGLELRSRRYS